MEGNTNDSSSRERDGVYRKKRLVRSDDFYRRRTLISKRDSTGHHYQVNIFPLDSFSFSLQEGFRGKAHSIELIGKTHQQKETSALNDSIASKQQKSNYSEKSKTSQTESISAKYLRKQNFKLISFTFS